MFSEETDKKDGGFLKIHSKLKLTSMPVLAALVIVILLSALWGMNGLEQNSSGKSLNVLEDAIRRAAVQCYALEGSYPPDLYYLADHYGIILNEDAYFYHYQMVGSNIMPDILVMKK